MTNERNLSSPQAIIAEHLRVGVLNAKQVFEGETNPGSPEWNLLLNRVVTSFTTVALMAELHRVAPTRAAQVARHLCDAWEDGASVHEFLHEWSAAHAVGQPVGFDPDPTLGLEVSR